MLEMILNAVKELFFQYGGWLLVAYIIWRGGIWIVRYTKTEKDDAVLDNFVKIGIDFALKVMPENTAVNWLKLTKNALSKFVEAYTASQGDAPDMTTYEKAKKLIEEIATQKETAELKNLNG